MTDTLRSAALMAIDVLDVFSRAWPAERSLLPETILARMQERYPGNQLDAGIVQRWLSRLNDGCYISRGTGEHVQLSNKVLPLLAADWTDVMGKTWGPLDLTTLQDWWMYVQGRADTLLELDVEQVQVALTLSGVQQVHTARVMGLLAQAVEQGVLECDTDDYVLAPQFREGECATATPSTALVLPGQSGARTALELKQVSDTYLNGEPFDLVRIRSECQGHALNIAQSMVELGRRLLAVKEVLGYGGFTSWLEEDSGLNMSQDMVQRFMGCARAVLQRPELLRVTGMGVTKAAALLALPDEHLDEMAEHGTLGGQPLDEVEVMTRRELLKRLKSLKKQVTEAKDDRARMVEEVTVVRDLLTEARAQVGAATMARPAEREQQLMSDLRALQDLLTGKLGWIEQLDVTQLSDDGKLRVRAWTDWLLWRAERTTLVTRDRLSDCEATSALGGATGEAFNANEARKADFQGTWS